MIYNTLPLKGSNINDLPTLTGWVDDMMVGDINGEVGVEEETSPTQVFKSN